MPNMHLLKPVHQARLLRGYGHRERQWRQQLKSCELLMVYKICGVAKAGTLRILTRYLPVPMSFTSR